MSDERDRLTQALANAGRGALIPLDFDGTLAPLVPDPSTSRLVDGARDVIVQLARQGVRIAIITGRGAATAVELSGLHDVDGLVVHGLYGAEQWRGGELTTQPDAPQIDAARPRVNAEVASTPGAEDAWVEDKRLSLVVHTRRSADPAGLLERLRAPITTIATDSGLEVHDGHFVLELRLPGFDKGQVLSTLIAEHEPAAVLYCGDDVGDQPAFERIADLRSDGSVAAFAVLVGPGNETLTELADVVVDTPADLVTLLRDIAAVQR